jgi:hypothetical protein
MRAGTDLPQYVGMPCWEITPADLTNFLDALPAFVPPGSVLCLEGVAAPDIEGYLTARPGPFENKTNQGFLKMRPKVFFIPITAENLHGLAELSSGHAEPEVCSHLRVYRDETIILSWHDLPTDPFYVTSEIHEAAIKRFCDALGCEYVFNATAG